MTDLHPIPAGPLQLPHVTSLLKALLSDAVSLVDGPIELPPLPTDQAAAQLRLMSLGFHLDRARDELDLLTRAGGPPAPGATVPHWHGFLLPRDVRQP